MGHTDEELLPPETAAKLREFDLEVLRTGQPITRDECITDPSGRERWFLSKKMPVKLADGTPCLIGLSTDITERMRLDEELRRSEMALLSILTNLPYPTMVTTLPPRESVTFVNSRFAETFGYTGEEFDSLHAWSKLAHPDEKYRSEVAAWWNTAVEGVLQQGGVVEAREVRVTAKDGRNHDVIASATVAGERLVVTLRDITRHKEEEEKLRISEERHRFLADSARDTVWTMEPDGRISYVSPSVEIVRGLTPDEAMAQTPEQIHPPESLAVSAKWWEQIHADITAGKKPQPFRGELAYYRKDGSVFWSEVMAYPLVHPDGSLAQVVGVTRDIAERKEAELLLRRSETKFRSIFEASRDGLMILDAEGRFAAANPATLEIFGSPDLQAFLHSSPVELSPALQPDGRSSAEAAREKGLAALGGQTLRFEWVHRRMDDGREFPCRITLTPIEIDGKPAVLSSAEDLTEKKRAEQALVKAEEQYRMRTETIKDVIWSFDPETRKFLYMAPSCERLFGFTPAELMARPITETLLTRPDQIAQLEEMIRTGLAGFLSKEKGDGDFISAELEHTRKDGSSVFAELSYRFLRNPDTGRVEVLGATRDVTQRRETEQKLRQRERELEQAKEHYRLLLENSTDVVVQGSNEGTINWVTPSVTGLVGWLPDEMVGRDFSQFVHPDDLDALRPFQENLLRGIGGQLGLRIRKRDGRYHWVSIAVRPIFNDHGEVTGRVAGWRDIHAEMLSRAAMENERTRLKATMDSLLDPYIMLRPLRDSDGKITDFIIADANPAACAHDNIEREKLVGSSLLTLLPAHRPSGLFDKYCETVETGRPLRLENFIYKDETQGGAERRLNLSGAKVGEALSLTWRDVTDHYLAAEKTARSEEHYRLLSRNVFGAVVRSTDAGVITWVSPSVKNVLGYEPGEWVGRPATDFMTPETATNVQPNIQRAIAEKSVRARYQARDKSGALHWVETFATPYVDSQGRRDGIVVSFHLIDEQVAAEQELEHRARTDELTKLLNRREVLERIDTLKGRSLRSGKYLAVLFVDFDRFKTINDTHGHAAGDEVLRVTADRIRGCLRDSDDLGARVGGDELMVVLHGVHGVDDAIAVAEKLRQSAAEPVRINGTTIAATVSIGVTIAAPDESTDVLVARADEAMYRAKQAGRNQVIPIGAPA